MPNTDFTLYLKQWETIADTTSPARAFVGGYGSGKTRTLVTWAIDRALRNPRGSVVLLVEPTWGLVKKVLVPELISILEAAGIEYTVNKADWTFAFEGRTIWCQSGEIPENISGLTVACAGIDEPAIQDEEVDRRVSSRVRDPKATCRQVLYVGTHEGLGWVYRKTQQIPTVVAPSWENPFLPQDFLHRLRARFGDDDVRWRMYVLGEATSLQGGIYTRFADRHRVRCSNPRVGNVVVGADFNVGFMCWPIARRLGNELHVCGEVISRNSTTEDHVRRVRDYLKQHGLAKEGRGQFGGEITDGCGERVEVFMDASGNARKTSATRTDKAIVKDAGFWPVCPSSNPLVRDRIELVQYALGRNLLYVDPEAAPFTCRALKEHAYAERSDPPAPQKKWKADEDPLDAATDALGYLVVGTCATVLHGSVRAA